MKRNKLSKLNQGILVAYEKGYRPTEDYETAIGPRGTRLKLRPNKGGYLTFNIRVKDIIHHITFHRLVAYYKFGARIFKKGMQVRHLDGNKLNNHIDNIGIGTARDNALDIPREQRIANARAAAQSIRRFTDEQVAAIRRDHASGLSYSKLAIKYNTAKSTLNYVLKRAYY